jgi:hypothetical protein
VTGSYILRRESIKQMRLIFYKTMTLPIRLLLLLLLLLLLCCVCPYCNYLYLHFAVSVIGLLAVDSAHKNSKK